MGNKAMPQIISDNLKGLYTTLAAHIRSEVTNEYILLLEYPYEDILFMPQLNKNSIAAVIASPFLKDRMPVVVFMNPGKESSPLLKNTGFIPLTRWKGMAIETNVESEPVQGLEFIHVDSASVYKQWEEVSRSVFHAGELQQEKLPYDRIYSKSGMTFILGLYNNQPACTGALYEDNASAGLYFIGTRPEFRGKGIGSALTKHLVSISKRRKVVLQATMDGFKVYSRLGFQEFCNFDLYRYMPDDHE